MIFLGVVTSEDEDLVLVIYRTVIFYAWTCNTRVRFYYFHLEGIVALAPFEKHLYLVNLFPD